MINQRIKPRTARSEFSSLYEKAAFGKPDAVPGKIPGIRARTRWVPLAGFFEARVFTSEKLPLIIALLMALFFLSSFIPAHTAWSLVPHRQLNMPVSQSFFGDTPEAVLEKLNAEYNIEGSNIVAPDAVILKNISYKTYTVQKGDSVSAIGLRFGLNPDSIISLNNISNVRYLRAGSTIKIPNMDGVLHVVSKGESLETIAARYKINVNAVLDVNNLSTSTIKPGQQLYVPGAKMQPFDLKKAMGELFIYPVLGRKTSGFGYRQDPISGKRAFHHGLDLANKEGTRIIASMDGTVVYRGYSNIYGKYVVIAHARGYKTWYAHLSSIGVKRGQYVKQGQFIGGMGNTGYSTGPHLHFAIYRNGRFLDPLSYLHYDKK